MKEVVVSLVAEEIGFSKEDVGSLLEVPPLEDLGDYAFPCFALAKSLKKSPLVIAEDLMEKLRKRLPKEISNIDFKGGYVNFFVDKKILAERDCDGIFSAEYTQGFSCRSYSWNFDWREFGKNF